MMSLTADQIKQMLGLQKHPTCGFVAETYSAVIQVPANSLPAAFGSSARPVGSALYFLVTPDAHMVMHRVLSDQQYHHYLGDPLEVLTLYPDGSGAVTVVGSDLAAGQRPLLFIPGSTFHVSRLLPGGSYALLSAAAWPAVEPADFKEGDRDALVAAFPDFAQQIRDFMG
jgi:uncharacterized protein